MSLSDIASIGSLISGLAVLVSLVYLSLQVRQAERNQRAVVNQGLIGRWVDGVFHLVDPTLGDLHFSAMTGVEDYSGADVLRLMNVVITTVAPALDAWVQREAHLIDDRMFEIAMRQGRIMFSTPVYRAIWPMARGAFPRAFGEVFEKELSSIPLREPVDLVAQLKANLAALRERAA